MLFEKKAKKVINTEIINKGNNVLINETPELLIATNSLFSPRLPKVIIDDNKIANGNASGVILTAK